MNLLNKQSNCKFLFKSNICNKQYFKEPLQNNNNHTILSYYIIA